jgi:rubrerythrin
MASNILSPQEILKIAIKVEENGKKLYGILEEKAKDEEIKKIWRFLKEQEEEHRKVFQKMLENVGEYIVYEFSPGEYEAYLKAIASMYVFAPQLIEEKTKTLFKSDLEAVEFGIYIETDSILVYSAFKEYVMNSKQHILEKVINEERNHLVRLVNLKEAISRRKEF